MSAGNADTAQHEDIVYPSAIPFVVVHLLCFAAIWSGVTWQSLTLCIALYWVRLFAIGAGYHRYFSHRAYSTSRIFQFFLAFLAQTSAQKSVLWWAAKHRHHHLHSDTEQDVHSPRHKGFLYSHVGWIFNRRHAKTDLVKIDDFARYPELMWLHRLELAPAVALGVVCFLIDGWSGLVVGFFWSTVLVYHGTFCINSLAHVRGKRRYVTGDDSRNNWLLALLTMGEGWHNNHHAYQSSVRQGFRWWEIDATFYILKLLSWTGIVWDMKTPPLAVRRNLQRLGSRVIERSAAQLASSFNPDLIVRSIMTTIAGPSLVTLQEKLAEAQHRAADVLATWHLPHMPTRQELLARATSMFAETPSMEDIVNRAHAVILDHIGARLTAALLPATAPTTA
ncbi:MAG TPA: acyl-CoA desaturase [Xanthobacteraceae bacterium]|jgi:stearoyl-CoA desaturase (delta-9 desaturase)|nr:acyl-CoA desaturase [Xanthobacteraceae bacterium]